MECLKKLNYYERLGVEVTANPEQIRHSFRTLAQSLHPDAANPGDSPERVEFFKLITEAYNTLVDPAKREKYNIKIKASEDKKRAKTVLLEREDLFIHKPSRLNQLKSSPTPAIRYKAQPPIPTKKPSAPKKRRKKVRKRKNSLILACTGLLRLLGVGSY